MKKFLFLFILIFCLTNCSDNKTVEEIPIIDVLNSIGKYQKVYCSDLFSSIELIPLETSSECLLDIARYPVIKDNTIFMKGNSRLYAFDRTGKFLSQIGERGQGPGEYSRLGTISINTNKPTLFIEDFVKILEYDFSGKFIRSFEIINVDGERLEECFMAEENLFVGYNRHNGKNKYGYCLFNQQGDTVKCFPNHLFYNKVYPNSTISIERSLKPVRVDNRIYLKDYVNDTIYLLENRHLQPAFIFNLGKYTFPIEALERTIIESLGQKTIKVYENVIQTSDIVGTPDYLFYQLTIPEIFSRPKAKPVYNPLQNEYRSSDGTVYGIYDITRNTNILLDTDEYFQKGIVNDINGGLPFIPRYYAGNNEVADVWNPEDMLGMLKDDYFSKRPIKDLQAHQKLKELLKQLKFDDNPVVVIAKLK